MARRDPGRGFSRTDRIGEAVREIVATELDRIGDERLELVTVTGVRVDGDLGGATVFYSALTAAGAGRAEEVAGALEEIRWPVQKVVNREIRARRTPQIRFAPDDVLAEALRIDDLVEGRAPDAAEDGDDAG